MPVNSNYYDSNSDSEDDMVGMTNPNHVNRYYNDDVDSDSDHSLQFDDAQDYSEIGVPDRSDDDNVNDDDDDVDFNNVDDAAYENGRRGQRQRQVSGSSREEDNMEEEEEEGAGEKQVTREDHDHHQDILSKLLSETVEKKVAEEIELELKDDVATDFTPRDGFCIECCAVSAELHCLKCEDDFCTVCFQTMHRAGNRKSHETKAYEHKKAEKEERDFDDENFQDGDEPKKHDDLLNVLNDEAHIVETSDEMTERAKYIPLRLTFKERKFLRLIEASLHVSEYTDRVDVDKFEAKPKRTIQQIKEICAILSGVIVSIDYKSGQNVLEDREFCRYKDLYKNIFEISRRYKILNPERMRSSYGKLIYFLQDTCDPEISEILELNCVRPLQTVYSLLQDRKRLDLLKDPNIEMATKVITSEGKSRMQIQKEIKKKNAAVKYISRRYSTRLLSVDDIERCLHSINDNNTFLYANRDPCDKMIEHLKNYFSPDTYEEGFQLGIIAGEEGARLTHNHTRQYHYCLQSLTLWREILHDFFRLWYFAEQDLLNDSTPYQLKDTGQGLNRLQNCPRTFRLMQNILSRAQQRVEQWIGSSVVHLGDHNVPNSLMFISKYTQISQILNPICICLEKLEEICANKYIEDYIEMKFGGVEKLRKLILKDFFCHAFDGSGADNFFDAGSCIDGRLTSAWNWCSQLETKDFYPVFLLTGFIGFDGEFE